MDKKLTENALDYHTQRPAGKIKVAPTKPLTTQEDLALAYSPGVAAACEAIVDDPNAVSQVTVRGNLVAVVTNGTAVLGLGAIGPLAAKPVMEGKGVLFKKFADIDVFDIEINEKDPDRLVDIIAALEPTFGGVNLEDIKAPECFEVERKLRDRLSIPVFHDDQHGTAIITAAAVINALQVVDKRIEEITLVTSGAGAAGMACLDLLITLGMKREHILVTDRSGVIYAGRKENMQGRKAEYAVPTEARTLADAIVDADIFLGVSGPGILTQAMVRSMARAPIILALANPVPEIMPEQAIAARPDAIIATGRSDYPNQVNNVLCFPYIFRGALDVGANTINEEMKLACVHALADLARREVSDPTLSSAADGALGFGSEYLIPRPFDPRLLTHVAPAVARAAMKSGVATRPIGDMAAYQERLTQFVFRTGLLMKPMFNAAKSERMRVAYCEGEDSVVLRAVQTVVDDALAWPILIGRNKVIAKRIKKLGLRLKEDRDYECVNPEGDRRFRTYWMHYHQIMERRGVSPDGAKKALRTRSSVIGAMMVELGDADGMLCGVIGRPHRKRRLVLDIVGLKKGVRSAYALSVMTNEYGVFFLCDTHVNHDPDAQQIAECTMLAVERMRDFGIRPKVALLSHSNFGTHSNPSATKMRKALEILQQRAPELEVEGEMNADAALSEVIRSTQFPNSRLSGTANLLVMPNVDAANIALHMSRLIGGCVTVGPMMLGAAKPVHVLAPSPSSRRVVNMTAVVAVDAQRARRQQSLQFFRG